MNKKTYQNFHCHDGSLATVVGWKQSNGQWALYSMSEVLGMGIAEYEHHILNTYYDEVVGFNSFSGLSYIATKQINRWGLIQLRNNRKVEGEWKLVADNIYDSLNDVLAEFGVDREEYIEGKEKK